MSSFSFKEFIIRQDNSALKVGTDAMLLGALIEPESHNKCLDIGAGTGVLSLMIAQRNSTIEIDAIEIDCLSFIDLKLNFSLSKWSDRLNGICEDFFSFRIDEFQKYDLIVSNPPFYETTFQNNQFNIAKAKHESHLPFESLFMRVNSLLTNEGMFWMILPTENTLKWKEYCLKLKLYCIKEITLFAKPCKSKRSVLVFSKTIREFKQINILIRNENNTYSEDYRRLTLDFHNKEI
jgi:tRNA1Val (adenine37-N6)-methyltransferase